MKDFQANLDRDIKNHLVTKVQFVMKNVQIVGTKLLSHNNGYQKVDILFTLCKYRPGVHVPDGLTDEDIADGFLSEGFAAAGWGAFQDMLQASIAAQKAKVNNSDLFSDSNFDHVNGFLTSTLHTETVWDLTFYVGIQKSEHFGGPDRPVLYIVSLDNPRDPDDVVAAAAPAPAPAAAAAAAVTSTEAAAATTSPAAESAKDDDESTPSFTKRRRTHK